MHRSARLRLGLLVLVTLLVAGCAAGATSTPSADAAPTTVPTATVVVRSPADPSPSPSTSPIDEMSGLPWIDATALPPEVVDTLGLIEADGPFPHPQDGRVFENREGILPAHPEGYYREYTVATPGSDDRGARRLVTGATDEIYYTDDHYESFSRVQRP